MQKNIGTGFAILPSRVFHFYVAAATDTWDEYHRCGSDLIHVTGIMSGPTYHVQIGVSNIVSCIEYPLNQAFVKG